MSRISTILPALARRASVCRDRWGRVDSPLRRVWSFLVGLMVMPGLCLGPCLALETMPGYQVGAMMASADLLPSLMPERESSRLGNLPPGPWHPDWLEPSPLAVAYQPILPQVLLLETPNELLSTGPVWLPATSSLMANEEAATDATGEASLEDAPQDATSLPALGDDGDEPIGADPPTESDEVWEPDEAPENAEGEVSDLPAEGPRDPLLVEQRVGNCVITGEVSDATTLDPIEGAIVSVLGTGREDETDAQGRFEIDGLPSGDFAVEVLKLGYSIGETSASPRPGFPAEVRVALRVKATNANDGEYVLSEETIVGEYNEANQGDFNLDLTTTASLSSGLSAEDFAKENVSDAGEALAKISGANVVGGKFAVVRGLADRYVSTTFNGGQISSAVSDRKAIELDLFPTSAIQAIDVAKTYRPSLLGDFGGAAIDIQSRNFPSEPIAFVKFKGKYNPDLPDQFLTVPGKRLGHWGETENPLDTNRFTATDPDSGAVRLITSPEEEAASTWKALEATRSPYPVLSKPEDEYSYALGFGDTIEVTDYLDIGFLVGHGWKRGSAYNESNELRAPERSWYQQDYKHFTEWDVYAAASARLNDDHEVNFVYFRKHIGEQNVRFGSELRDPNNDDLFQYGNSSIQNVSGTRRFYGADAEQSGNFYELKPLERDLRIIQTSGKSRFGDRGVKMRWSFTDSDAEEIQPHTTFQTFTTLDFDSPALDLADLEGQQSIREFAEDALGVDLSNATYDEVRQLYIDLGAEAFLLRLEAERLTVRDPSLGKRDTVSVAQFTGSVGDGNLLTRATQSVRESTVDSSIAFDIPYYFSEDNEDSGFELGLGAGRIEKIRQNRGSLYELVYENVGPDGSSRGGYDVDELYPTPDGTGANRGEALVGDASSIEDDITGTLDGAPYYQDGSVGVGNFAGLVASNADATHDFESWFVSGNLFFENYFIQGGIRHETEVREARFLEPKPLNEVDPEPIRENVWLPSVTTGASVFDGKLNLLAAWSRTLARPTFFEWVPVRSFDLSTGFVRSGNPDLINSTINNFDFTTEFNPDDDKTFRLSFFRKEIFDPIVGVRVPGVADSITFINGDKGSIAGAEIEAEIREIGPFSLKTNVTYIDAALDYEFNSGEQVSVNFPFQPNWIANVNLGYDHEEWDFGINLVYNYTGEYATLLKTTPSFPDVVRESQKSLDLVIRKGFELPHGGKLGVSVGVENLIADDQVFRFDGGSDEIDGQIRSTLQTNRLYFAEVKYDF